jgi:hypothetical protein
MKFRIRHGRTKKTIESSIDCSLLAVEIYNKPRTTFRRQAYISLMMKAWVRLFHAYFNQKIGDKYYYKKKNGKYKRVSGEKKSWELSKCINEFNKLEPGYLNQSVLANLDFFIKMRNKVEHRYVNNDEIDNILFGECQSLLYNFENLLINFFGEQYSINQNLAFSLQFSRKRTSLQNKLGKEVLAKDALKIKKFIEDYKKTLSQEVFDSQDYSIKLIQIPKISNTSKSDLAIEFVNWSSLNKEDKDNFERLSAIVKDKIVKIEAVNVGKLKPSKVLDSVNKEINEDLSHYDLNCLYYIFSIKPTKGEDKSDFETILKFCVFDETHQDYIYTDVWVEFIINLFNNYGFSKKKIKGFNIKREKLDFNKFMPD